MQPIRRVLRRACVVGIATATATIGLPALGGLATAATPGAPGAPTGVTAADTSGGEATVSWTAPSGGAVGYNVYDGTSATSLGSTPVNGSTLVTGTSTLVSGLSTTAPTYFAVEAVNQQGTSAPSSVASTTAANVAPAAPTGVSAAPAGPTAITLTWTPSATNGAGGTSGLTYQVFQGTTAGGESATALTPTVTTNSSGQDTATISGLTTGTPYYFTIKADNTATSLVSVASSEVTATPANTVPTAPTGVTVTGSTGTTVTLSWTASTAQGSPITGYNVYEGTTAGGESSTPVNGAVPITGTTETVPSLTAGTTYYFTVKAVSALGTSAASNEVSATPTSATPGAPTGLTATTGYNSASLSWTAPTAATTSPITSYTVLVGTTSGGEATPLTPIAVTYGAANASGTPATTATVTGLSQMTKYYFEVEATNANGTGPASNEASATTAPSAPGAPTTVTATSPSATSVTVTWAAPANTGAATPITYIVYEGTPSTGTQVATGTTTSATVSNLQASTSYTFYVVAMNGYGNSPASSTVTISTGAAAPQPPTALTATAVTGSATTVNLTWTAPANQGGSTVTGYTVLVGTSASGEAAPAAPVTAVVTGTSAVVAGLTAGTTYYFEVEAVNGSTPGTSAPSNQVVYAPSSTAGMPTAAAAAGYQSVTLTITPPTSSNGSTVTGYNVYEGTTPGGESTTPVNSTPVTATTYTVTGLSNGTTYYFTVKAVNSVGTGVASNEVHATPAPSAPAAPTGVTATASGTLMDLSWTAPTTLNGSTIEGYLVFDGTSALSTAATPLNSSSNLVQGTSTVIDGLTPGTTYYFAVEAVGTNGTSAASANSAGVLQTGSGVVPGAPTTPVAVAGTAAGSVQLTWSAPASNGGSAITGYIVTPIEGGTALTAQPTGSTATSYTVTGLTPGTVYEFTVEAVNVAGDSPASGVSNPVTAPSSAPVKPTIAVSNRTGRGNVIVAGRAAPGAAVALYEEPYGAHSFSRVAVKSAAVNGTYSFAAYVHNSTYFTVSSDNLASGVVRTRVGVAVSLGVTSGARRFTARVSTNPSVTGVRVTFYKVVGRRVSVLGSARITRSSGVLSKTFNSAAGSFDVRAVVAGGDGAYGGTSTARPVRVRI